MFSSIVSIMYSFEALSPTSTQMSTLVRSPISKTFVKVNPSVGLTSNPTALLICCQCLSVIPCFLRLTRRGTLGLNSSIYYLMLLAILRTGSMSLSLKNLMTPVSILTESSTNRSAATASTFSHSSLSQL